MNENDPRKPLADLIIKNGLDPEWIAADGLSHEGYFAFVRKDASANRVHTFDDSAVKEWAPWPTTLLNEPTFREALSRASQYLLRIHDRKSA